MRPRGQVELKDRRLIVSASYKTHFRIEVLFGDSVPRIKIEPVVGIGHSSAKCRVIIANSLGPRLCVIPSQIQIFKKDEFGIETARSIVGIKWIARLLIRRHKADV